MYAVAVIILVLTTGFEVGTSGVIGAATAGRSWLFES
jgi:hypothetical protein